MKLWERIQDAWCYWIHFKSAMWPMNGAYTCRKCQRTHLCPRGM